MLSANFQLCFAVLLATICHVKPHLPSHHKTLLHGLNETRCRWNCTAIDSDLTEEMKNTIAEKKSVRLVVKYEKKVDSRCVNQTSSNSSGKGQIWLLNKQLSNFAGILESLANLMPFADLNEEHKEIRAICTLRPVSRAATTGPEYNITNTTGNNIVYFPNPFERGGWPMTVVDGFYLVFVAVFMHYSPALLCLLSPTEVTEDGVRQIILEGASPVSVRSLIGNYFFSENDETVWHKTRTFVFRAVIMPLPFIGLGILDNVKCSIENSFLPLKMICFGCYVIQEFYISFFTARSIQAKPCLVCKLVKPKVFSCQDELPQLILGHLRLQPLILLECFRLFHRCIVSYFKIL